MVAIIAPPYIMLSVSLAFLTFLAILFESKRDKLNLLTEIRNIKVPLLNSILYFYVLLGILLLLFSACEICILEPKNEVTPIIFNQSISIPFLGNILILGVLLGGLCLGFIFFFYIVVSERFSKSDGFS